MYRPHRLQTSRARWQMPRHSRPRKLRADAERRRLTQHCAHQISCALYLCRQRRAEVSSPRRNPRRCRTNTLIFARIAAAKGNDRAQFSRAHFPEDRDLLERSTMFGHYLVELGAVIEAILLRFQLAQDSRITSVTDRGEIVRVEFRK